MEKAMQQMNLAEDEEVPNEFFQHQLLCFLEGRLYDLYGEAYRTGKVHMAYCIGPLL